MDANKTRKLVWPAWHGAHVYHMPSGYVWRRDDVGHLAQLVTPVPEHPDCPIVRPMLRCVLIPATRADQEADDGNN